MKSIKGAALENARVGQRVRLGATDSTYIVTGRGDTWLFVVSDGWKGASPFRIEPEFATGYIVPNFGSLRDDT